MGHGAFTRMLLDPCTCGRSGGMYTQAFVLRRSCWVSGRGARDQIYDIEIASIPCCSAGRSARCSAWALRSDIDYAQSGGGWQLGKVKRRAIGGARQRGFTSTWCYRGLSLSPAPSPNKTLPAPPTRLLLRLSDSWESFHSLSTKQQDDRQHPPSPSVCAPGRTLAPLAKPCDRSWFALAISTRSDCVQASHRASFAKLAAPT
ncbi:hypothetical protein T440DRAFT_224967 [Plenodomus tracheiphilus IPT5]|uniref:Uncharacterized protein n=1 Tax=Plenodomus tracheiphilus IPT5 TaxID=1408161 RepID=A0A6A7AWA9_9PLEO|nr:hypothetical protein T440DRAFT_224967 [Plenodomus tracheiphilus IPT5]